MTRVFVARLVSTSICPSSWFTSPRAMVSLRPVFTSHTRRSPLLVVDQVHRQSVALCSVFGGRSPEAPASRARKTKASHCWSWLPSSSVRPSLRAESRRAPASRCHSSHTRKSRSV